MLLTRQIAAAASAEVELLRRQVDHALALARQNQIKVARVLLEEVQRIRDELGPMPDAQAVAPIGHVIPTVHPWAHPVIPEIAATDATIVGAFLALDRELDNYRGADED